MEFTLISQSNNVAFYRRGSEIKIISDINLDTERFQKVMDLISNGGFFSSLCKINKGLIQFFHQDSTDSSIMTMFVKNDFDEDDEELGYLCFKTESTVSNDSATITGKMDSNDEEALDKYDEDRDAEKISFDKFSVVFNRSQITFNLTYCNNKHPTYIGNLIGKYFEKMFISFSKHIAS